MGRYALTAAERTERYRQKKKGKLRNAAEILAERQKELARVKLFRTRLTD